MPSYCQYWGALATVVLVLLGGTRIAAAQDVPSGTSYLTPFPEGDTYKLQVYGDAFAEGLVDGLAKPLPPTAGSRLPASIAPWPASRGPISTPK